MKTIHSASSFLYGLFLFSVSAIPLHSQQLEISYSRGSGSYMTFGNWEGYSIGWNHKLKSGSKIGISFDHAISDNPYSWIHDSYDRETDITKTYIENRDPYNQRFSAAAIFGWCAHLNNKAAIYWGPKVSMNWLRIHEKTHRYANEWFQDAEYYSLFTRNHRLGLGLFLEFEIRNVVFDRLSASMRLHCDATGYNTLGLWNRSDPGTIFWSGADIGLKWNFGKMN